MPVRNLALLPISEIAAATLQEPPRSALVHRPARSSSAGSCNDVDPLHTVVTLPATRPCGVREVYYFRLGAEYYDAAPPTVGLVEPDGVTYPPQQSRWFPVLFLTPRLGSGCTRSINGRTVGRNDSLSASPCRPSTTGPTTLRRNPRNGRRAGIRSPRPCSASHKSLSPWPITGSPEHDHHLRKPLGAPCWRSSRRRRRRVEQVCYFDGVLFGDGGVVTTMTVPSAIL